MRIHVSKPTWIRGFSVGFSVMTTHAGTFISLDLGKHMVMVTIKKDGK